MQASELEIMGQKLVALSFNPEKTGTPVIFIHGILASIYFWTYELIEPFMELGPCYSLSLPGHYPAAFSTSFSSTSLTEEMLAKSLSIAIHQLTGNQPVILVGHSTGGFASLNIAAHFPHVSKSIISVSGFANGRWTGLFGIYQLLARCGTLGKLLLKALFKLGYLKFIYRATAQLYARNWRQFKAHPYFEKIINTNAECFRKLDLDVMVQYFSVMPKVDISTALSKITSPTLIITGAQDPFVPYKQSQIIKQALVSSDLVIIKNAGHFPFYENPIDYKMTINKWFEKYRAVGKKNISKL